MAGRMRRSLASHFSTSSPGPAGAAGAIATIAFLTLFTLFTSAANAAQPVDVVFVLDNSGSMKTNDPAFLTRRAVAHFAKALAEDEELDGRIGIILFDEQARLAQALIPAKEVVSRDVLSRALAALDFSGQRTNSPVAIERALYELREHGRENARKAIVFLSDGKIDTGNARNDLEVARWLREDLAGESEAKDIRIFGIAFTDEADYQLMQALARRTRAHYYRAFDASELATVVTDVLATIDEPPVDGLADLGASEDAFTAEALPAISSAPLEPTAIPNSDTTSRLLGWLPIALLLVASAVYFGRRDRTLLRIASQAAGVAAPPAQLLDPGGQLGEAGTAIRLNVGRTTIGRDPRNDIVLKDDTVSSEHAVIETHEGRYWLQNLRSTNGTKLADRRLAPDERAPLKGGDHIRFADVDLMFVMDGYVPGGATVYLSSSTTPAEGWQTRVDPVDAASSEVVFAEHRERLDPASVLDLDDEFGDGPSLQSRAILSDRDEELAQQSIARAEAALVALSEESAPPTEPDSPRVLSLLPNPKSDPAPVSQTPAKRDPRDGPTAEIKINRDVQERVQENDASKRVQSDSPARDIAIKASSLRECLDFHLARVSEISPAFARFVDRAFDQELRSALPVAASDLLKAAHQSGRIESREYTFDRVRYLICGVPAAMDEARALFIESFGGFTRVLSEQLQAESFRGERCEILALLSFGAGEAPWVSLTIVPDEGQELRIDLLSYEFLTEKERLEIAPSVDSEISQSGLA